MIDLYDLALIVLGALLVLIAAALFWRRLRSKVPPAPPYALQPEFLSYEECALLPLIEQAFGDDFRILFKIPLQELLQPTAPSAKKRRRALEALMGRTVPFVLCRRADFTPEAAIAPGERGDAPLFPELSACGLVVMQLSATSLPSPRDIRSEFERLSSGDKKESEEESAEEEDDWRIGSVLPQNEEEGGWLDGISTSPATRGKRAQEEVQGGAQLLCPECAVVMTRRRMVRGPHAGREIWVCSKFPTCRKTVPVLPD